MTYRYYDPETARFLNRDPIGYAGGMNLHTYADNNPGNEVDPLGLCACGQGGQGGSAGPDKECSGAGSSGSPGDDDWDYVKEMDRFRRSIPLMYSKGVLRGAGNTPEIPLFRMGLQASIGRQVFIDERRRCFWVTGCSNPIDCRGRILN